MKNKIEHTPGPWAVRDEYDGTLPVDGWDEDLDASVEIARVSLDMLTPEQREANARLIAAAPELYSIMQEVYDASRLRRPIKKATFEKVCEVLRAVDGKYR